MKILICLNARKTLYTNLRLLTQRLEKAEAKVVALKAEIQEVEDKIAKEDADEMRKEQATDSPAWRNKSK